MSITPHLTERADQLGWIASVPTGFPLRFAVVADSKEEAEARFAEALDRWQNPPTAR